MEKLSAEQILAVLKEKCEISDIGYGDFNSEELGLGKCNKSIWEKGGEGEGEDWRQVHHFVDHDVYIEVNGHYISHDGVNFYDSFEDHVTVVTPKQKTITVYE